MRQMKFENLVLARETREKIIGSFTDDYGSVIDDVIKDKSSEDAEDILRQMSTTFLNIILNESHLFCEEEMNYVNDVRNCIHEKVNDIQNKRNIEFLNKKGKLTPEQMEKYSTKLPKVEKEKIEKFDRPQLNPEYLGKKTKDPFKSGVIVGALAMASIVVALRLFGLL